MPRLLPAIATSLLTAAVSAQLSVVVPNGTANVAGNTSNAFPWGTTASTWSGLRLMCVYGAVNFTSQAITSPILINRLKWRPDNNAPAYAGGSFTIATVDLSTSPTGWQGVTTNYTTNHGADQMRVYDAAVHGQVVHTATPGPAAWTPQSWCVDIQLPTPFLYDPSLGDLVIDVDYPTGSWTGPATGANGQMDVQSTGSSCSRIYASSQYPNANGTSQNHGVVVEVGYVPPQGYAQTIPYGTGCYDQTGTSFYELFAPGAHDLSNNSMSMFYAPGGYTVIGGIATLYPTTTATALALTGNSQVTMTLTSGAIPYGFNGLATQLTVCSNGFVSVGSGGNGTGSAPTVSTFLNAGRTGWWCWHDYNPGATGSGQVKWEETGTHVYVTWDGVYSNGTTGPGSTFQFQLEKGAGHVHVVWGTVDNTGNGHLVGFSEGGPSADPGSIDLSTALPSAFSNLFDIDGIGLGASARPVIGTSISLDTTFIPLGSPIGGTILSLTEHNPGLPLGGIGMPGCEQYVGIDAVALFFPSGTSASVPFVIPPDNGLASVVITAQSAAYAPGSNAGNAVSSNGLRLQIDLN